MNKRLVAVLAVAMVLPLGACGSSTGERGLTGAGLGAAAGGILGAATGGSVVGGAILGGAAGAAVGVLTTQDQLDGNRTIRRKRN